MSIAAAEMNRGVPTEAGLDDIDAYIATFDEEEPRDLAAAEAAIDIAILRHRARERRGLSQTAAARLAGLHQQAVSRFERPHANPQLETIQTYLGALGYALELRAIDIKTGETAAEVILPPTLLQKPRRGKQGRRQRSRSHRHQEPRRIATA